MELIYFFRVPFPASFFRTYPYVWIFVTVRKKVSLKLYVVEVATAALNGICPYKDTTGCEGGYRSDLCIVSRKILFSWAICLDAKWGLYVADVKYSLFCKMGSHSHQRQCNGQIILEFWNLTRILGDRIEFAWTVHYEHCDAVRSIQYFEQYVTHERRHPRWNSRERAIEVFPLVFKHCVSYRDVFW